MNFTQLLLSSFGFTQYVVCLQLLIRIWLFLITGILFLWDSVDSVFPVYVSDLFVLFSKWFPLLLILDFLLGLSDVVFLCHPGEDGGSTQHSGMAGNSLHSVNCSGENQRGKKAGKETCDLLCFFII